MTARTLVILLKLVVRMVKRLSAQATFLKDNKPEAVEKVLSDIAAVDKVVTKGTKTKTAITDVIPTAIKYVQDATLDKGVEKADDKHVGSRGYTTVTTTYKLDPVTGEITSSETKVVTPMVEKGCLCWN